MRVIRTERYLRRARFFCYLSFFLYSIFFLISTLSKKSTYLGVNGRYREDVEWWFSSCQPTTVQMRRVMSSATSRNSVQHSPTKDGVTVYSYNKFLNNRFQTGFIFLHQEEVLRHILILVSYIFCGRN